MGALESLARAQNDHLEGKHDEIAYNIIYGHNPYYDDLFQRLKKCEEEPTKLEHLILYKLTKKNNEYLEHLEEWVYEDYPTNLLSVILKDSYEINPRLLEFIKKNINLIITKKCNFEYSSFMNMLTKINFDVETADIFNWYRKTYDGDAILWSLIRRCNLEIYFKLEYLSSTFDPFSVERQNIKTYTKIKDIEIYVETHFKDEESYNEVVLWNLAKRDCSLDERMKFVQLFKKFYHYCDYKEVLYQGAINDYWDDLLDEINNVIAINYGEWDGLPNIDTCIEWGNTKLIDHIIKNYPRHENKIRYRILVDGSKDVVTYYFPEGTRESVNLLLQKLM